MAALGSCDGKPEVGLEAKHCQAVLGWMTKGAGEVRVLSMRAWEGGAGYNVTLSYELVPTEGSGAPNAPSRSFVQCRYAPADAEGKRRVWAESIVMGGTLLSSKQVQTINVTISLVGER